MADYKKHARLPGKLVFIGFGSVGQGSLPLLLRHLEIRNDGVMIINADDRGAAEAAAFGIPYRIQALTPQNWRSSTKCSSPATSCSTSRSTYRAPI